MYSLIDAENPDTRYFTRADFQLWCQRFALGLKQSGLVSPGDRILVFSPNDIFVSVVFMGTVSTSMIRTGTGSSKVAKTRALPLSKLPFSTRSRPRQASTCLSCSQFSFMLTVSFS